MHYYPHFTDDTRRSSKPQKVIKVFVDTQLRTGREMRTLGWPTARSLTLTLNWPTAQSLTFTAHCLSHVTLRDREHCEAVVKWSPAWASDF